MQGITIIEELVVRNRDITDFVLGLSFGLFLAIVMMSVAFSKHQDKPDRIACGIIGAIIWTICIWFCASSLSDFDETHIEYIVKIDETISMKDFVDTYEIIEDIGSYRYKVKLKGE